MPEENQQQHEITFILSPNLDKQGLASIEDEIKKKIQELEGSIKKKEEAKKQDLAYAINKFESGYYLTMDLFLSPEKTKQLAPTFKHNQDILRHFTTTSAERKSSTPRPKKEKKPSKKKQEKIQQMAEEVTEKEIQKLKKKEEKQKEKQAPKKKKEQKEEQPETEDKQDKKTELKDIDKKIDEILGT